MGGEEQQWGGWEGTHSWSSLHFQDVSRCYGPWSPWSQQVCVLQAEGGSPAEAPPGQPELTAWVGLDLADVIWILAKPQLFPEFQCCLLPATPRRYQHGVTVTTLKNISGSWNIVRCKENYGLTPSCCLHSGEVAVKIVPAGYYFRQILQFSRRNDCREKNPKWCIGYLSFSKIKASLLNEKWHILRIARDSPGFVQWLPKDALSWWCHQGRGSGSAGYWAQTWEPKMGNSYGTIYSSH